jgi:hypothetical protein
MSAPSTTEEALVGLISAAAQFYVLAAEMFNQSPGALAPRMPEYSDKARQLLQSLVCDAYVLTQGAAEGQPSEPLPDCCAACMLYVRTEGYCAPMVAHADDAATRATWCPLAPLAPTDRSPRANTIRALRARGLLRPYWPPEG